MASRDVSISHDNYIKIRRLINVNLNESLQQIDFMEWV